MIGFYCFQGSILLNKPQCDANEADTKEYQSDEEDDEARRKAGDEIVFPLDENGKKIPNFDENRRSKEDFSVEDDELLISLIHENEVIWDYKTRSDKQRQVLKGMKLKEARALAWTRISLAFKGKFSENQLKTRWQSLKQQHKKKIENEQGRSGDAAKTRNKEWSHYNSMEFLRGHHLLAE